MADTPMGENKFAATLRQHRERQAAGSPPSSEQLEDYSATNNLENSPIGGESDSRPFGPAPPGWHSDENYTQKSYRVRKDIHRAFKILCELQQTNMSVEIQDMILQFLRERTGAAPTEDPVQVVIANLTRFTVE